MNLIHIAVIVVVFSFVKNSNALDFREVFFSSRTGTFDEAQNFCKSMSSYVVRIDSDAENTRIYTLARTKTISRYWVDYNDIQVEGKWVCSDGSPLGYNKWATGQPDNFQNLEDCGEVGRWNSEYWNDIPCNTQNPIACYGGTEETNDEFFFSDKKAKYEAAQQYCHSIGLHLLRIESQEQQSRTYALTRSKQVSRYWIDYNDISIEGNWVNSDNRKMIYSKWGTEQPDNYNDEDCAEVGFPNEDFWNDLPCGNENTVVCSGRRAPRHNDYTFTEKRASFEAAQQYCHSLGLSVLRIENQEQQSRFYALSRSRKLSRYWIDYNDIKVEGNWVNSNNIQMSYSKWGPSQPDNYNEEDCVEFGFPKEDFWNDYPCGNENTVVCSG